MIQFVKCHGWRIIAMAACILSCSIASTAADLDPADLSLRLNQIQVIGTHNSYHLAPAPNLLALIAATNADVAKSIDYSHAPLPAQLSDQGIRQIELDLYADPLGGHYSKPIGMQWLGDQVVDSRMPFAFRETMDKPGIKIIHSPGFDFATTVPTLMTALQEVVQWSQEHPQHLPILILLEIKETVSGPAGVKPIPFEQDLLDDLDRNIRQSVPAEKLLLPDTLRGGRDTLREAILSEGWPQLSECLGKLIFALDNTDAVRDRYLEGHPSLKDRVMFVSVDEDHPAAGWMKINDAVGNFETIQRLVQKGFLVRTRADSDTRQARTNDTHTRDQAMASGAQFISTDYPVPDKRLSDYQVRWPSGAVYRRNPVSCP